MTSVERIHEYTNIPSESNVDSSDIKKPPPDWPLSGRISAADIFLKYDDHGPFVLKNLNFTIEAGEKVSLYVYVTILCYFVCRNDNNINNFSDSVVCRSASWDGPGQVRVR